VLKEYSLMILTLRILENCRKRVNRIHHLRATKQSLVNSEVVDFGTDYRKGYPRTIVLRGCNVADYDKLSKSIADCERKQKRVKDAIQNLDIPEHEKRVLILFYIEGLSLKDISYILSKEKGKRVNVDSLKVQKGIILERVNCG